MDGWNIISATNFRIQLGNNSRYYTGYPFSEGQGLKRGANIESSTINTFLGTVTTTTITSNSTDTFGSITIQSTQPPSLEEKDVVPSGIVYRIGKETGKESPDLEQQKDKAADNINEENK